MATALNTAAFGANCVKLIEVFQGQKCRPVSLVLGLWRTTFAISAVAELLV